MCTGAILLYRIPRVVIGENHNFRGEEDLLRSRGVEVVVLDNKECYDMMKTFIETRPEVCSVTFLTQLPMYMITDRCMLYRNGMKT